MKIFQKQPQEVLQIHGVLTGGKFEFSIFNHDRKIHGKWVEMLISKENFCQKAMAGDI